jgi:hypothetical protein
LSEAASQQWYDVALVGSQLYVSGDNRRLSKRVGPNTWQLIETAASGTLGALNAVGGVGNEAFAAGDVVNGTNLVGLSGTTWADEPALPIVQQVQSMFVAGPNEIYFGGVNSANDPVVIKGTR